MRPGSEEIRRSKKKKKRSISDRSDNRTLVGSAAQAGVASFGSRCLQVQVTEAKQKEGTRARSNRKPELRESAMLFFVRVHPKVFTVL